MNTKANTWSVELLRAAVVVGLTALIFVGEAAAQPYTSWQLGTIQFKDQYNGWAQNAGLLKILEQEANAAGGSLYVEANDTIRRSGVCRYRFTWSFGHDISRIAYANQATPVKLLIEGDGGSCVEMNPFMEFEAGNGTPTLESTASGKQFRYDTRHPFHSTAARSLRVRDRQSNQKNFQFEIIIHVGFSGREETLRLHIVYPYEGRTGGGVSETSQSDGLPSPQWQVCETYTHEICGYWTRGSDGRWSGQWGGVLADLSITLDGNQVLVTRRDRNSSLQATYRGTLNTDQTQITGRVEWRGDQLGTRSGTWRAQALRVQR